MELEVGVHSCVELLVLSVESLVVQMEGRLVAIGNDHLVEVKCGSHGLTECDDALGHHSD